MGLEILAVPLSAALILYGVAALVVHALVCLTMQVTSFKRYTAKQMLISFLVMGVGSAAAGGKVAMRTAGGILRWWLFFATVFIVFSGLYVTFTEYPVVWLETARLYNQNIGPYMYRVVVIPLQITDVLLRGLLPLWNSGVWFIKALGVQGLLPVLLENVDVVLKMGQTLISFSQHLTVALFSFLESFVCSGEACLQPERGVFDVLSSLGDVREFVALSVQLLRNFCGFLAAPIDLITFPLLDLNLAEGVHNLANALIQLMIVIPRTTVERCALKQGDQFSVLMCTPDMSPFFNFLAGGVSSIGLVVDNWANIAFLIIQEAVTRDSPTCDGSGAGAGLIPDHLLNETSLFGEGVQAVVVGLTDWLYAVTDGVKAVYAGHTEGAEGAIKMQLWPFPGMDVSLGVAAVTYSSVHDLDVSDFSSGKTAGSMQTTSMLACNCTNQAELGMVILCSILPMTGIPPESNPEDYLLQVLFPNTLVGRQYTCEGVDLYVKSVRWSFTRYQTEDATLGSARNDKTTLPTTDCISRGTCRELDATVWLIPRCGQDITRNSGEGCATTATCLPFCMAARSAGSGRDNLVLASARRWRQGLTVLGQDCAMSTATSESVGQSMGRTGAVSRAEGTRGGLLQGNGVAVHGFSYSESVACVRAPRMTSIVDKPKGERVAANVGLSGQPFAITGDTGMTMVDLGGGAVSVQVERLEGNEVDIFSLNGINQELPAHPRALVPLQEADFQDTEKLVVPYSYQTARIAAVNSRNYVFYASNPPMDVFGAYYEYCKGRDDRKRQIKMGLLLKSSYSPIRVYRVSAYRRCAKYSCGSNLVSFSTLEGFSQNFSRSCDEVFNVAVVGLEYLNEDNVAIMVQSSRVDEYDSLTGIFSGKHTRNRIMWLNPTTMRIKETIWQTSIPSSSFTTLCPSMQRLPRVGSFGSEIVNSVVFVVKFALFSIIYTPGMVPVWRQGGVCPQAGASMYHSVLGNCGGRLFALDDFFDSVDDAAAIFWHSLSLMGKLVTPSGQGSVTSPIRDVLDGMSQYGQGSIDLWAAGAGVLTLTRVPIKDQVTELWATIQAGTAGKGVQGLASGGAGVIAWSRFSYKAISTIVMDITRRILDPVELDKLTLSSVFKLIWADLYDLRDEFSTTITSRVRMGCGGLRLVFGLGNPWSNLVYYQCMASAEVTEDLMGLALNIFVQIPMAKCVCKDSAGMAVAPFVAKTCAPPLPLSLLPTLYMIANDVGSGRSTCARVLDSVKGAVNKSMDSWFENQYSALAALGSSVEYSTASFDPGAGKCMDFQNDPHVVVIVPWPVDYFQKCSGTSLCKQKCSAEWAQFQAAMAPAYSQLPSLSITTESMFFPGDLDTDLQLLNVQAVVELPASSGMCYTRAGSASPPDYVLAVAEVSWPSIRVEYWCSPRMASLTVYKNESAGYDFEGLEGTLLSLQFGDGSGEWLALLSQLDNDGGQAVVILNRTGVSLAPSFDNLIPAGAVLMRVANLWIINGVILVDLVTRRMQASQQSARSQAGVIHAFLRPPLNSRSLWVETNIDLMQFGSNQYWYTRLWSVQPVSGLVEYLFLPKRAGLNMHHIQITMSNSYIRKQSSEIWAPSDLSALSGAALSPVSQNMGYVFAASANGWDWLKQMRWPKDGPGVEGVFGSTKVEVEVQIQGNCNERGCEGCKTVTAQRFCLAYNKCALVNCVGTPVHQRRPLCGIGGLLQHFGEMTLQSTHAAWTILAEMLGLTLQLSLISSREAHLLWPEDAFLCYMCEAKDSSAEFFSILTATINSALQLGGANIGYMYGGASNVDTNADAVLTISSTALNAFMHQLALLPLYVMIATHQIMMCQVTGVLALMDASGFRLSLIQSGQASASESIAGQCLTVGAEVLANYPSDNPTGLGYTVMSFASNALQLVLIQQIDPFLHMIDASLAYATGVVHTLGVLIMSQSMAKCNPPDFFLKDIVKCACNDLRLQIPQHRRAEGAIEGALWCSGVLSMVDSNNQPYYVYNPFTYAQIQDMTAGLANYTECVTSTSQTKGYTCPVPNDPFFRAQGVTAVNVLVKCRENFIKNRWDPAAYMMYQGKYDNLLKKTPTRQERFLSPDPLGVRACLQSKTSGGSPAQECLQEFLTRNGVNPDDYWAYERTDANKTGPEYTDACQTFTGPAQKMNLSQFTSCVDGTITGQSCRLSGHIWTPLSKNNVAVAEQHVVMSHGANSDGMVQMLYKEASKMVLDAVQASLAVRTSGAEQPPIELEFFSVEGDVLHQTMDCIFMGPYSRVDYWPIPLCLPGDECLVGPHWSRDDNAGASRQVDPTTCQAEMQLPFTCGSPSRRSLMRYLVKEILPSPKGTNVRNGNATLAQRVIMLALESIKGDWNDTSTFGCDCGDGRFWPQCCAANATSELLPPSLMKPSTQINSSHVLQTLHEDFELMYNKALEETPVWLDYMPIADSKRFDWSDSERVQTEARFNPRNTVTNYSSKSDAFSPLLGGANSLWDVCHAGLKQVFFTLPTKDEAVHLREGMPAFDGDPNTLQEYVKLLLERAREDSPVFRHYSPRHAPTQSQMCADPLPYDMNVEEAKGRLSYSDLRQKGRLVVDGTVLPTDTPVFHPQLFRIGKTETCLCGWHREGSRCHVPSVGGTDIEVCKKVECIFANQTFSYSFSLDSLLWKEYSIAWFCPEFELSPHWGFTDPETMEEWLGTNQTNLMTSSRDLFTHGRAGLRPGNAKILPRIAKTYLNPTTREIPLERGRLKSCLPRPPPLEDLTQEWLDELFPAAQAVEEAGSTAYCLRYTIELARLEIFRLLNATETTMPLLVKQKEVAAVWKRRCGAQLHLLHLCKTLGVYRPLELNSGRLAPVCPHFQHVEIRSPRVVYTTQQCLVSIDNVLYDPCRCMVCKGERGQQALNLSYLESRGEACKLRWDPRTILTNAGPPIGWTDGVHPLADGETESLLGEDFVQRILKDADAVGNGPPQTPWWMLDGSMHDGGEFCDGVLDWWPEEWDYPVGYHVTVPCDANETAFRSFEQAFAWDEATHAMVYMHDLLRDGSLVDSHSGVGGLCRSNNFGMPMFETNTMQYCTRTPVDDDADFAVPIDTTAKAYTGDWSKFKCTSSSKELPWPDITQQTGPYQAARFSVGTVPNMPEEDSATYPASESDMFVIGPWKDVQTEGNQWGKGERACRDHDLLLCSNQGESVCPRGYACRGMVCMDFAGRASSESCSTDQDCSSNLCRGVCMEPSIECLRHEHCLDGKMCSGVGTCVKAVIAVQNRLIMSDEKVSFSLATNGDCQGEGPLDVRGYSLLGASFWGNTGQDLLRVHGMCSFEDWFKYTQIYAKEGCSSKLEGTDRDTTLDLDPTKCPMANMDMPTMNQSKWWPATESRPELMYLRPTNCDRDYERLEGFKQCAPREGTASLLYPEMSRRAVEYDRFVRLHDTESDNGKHIPLAMMPESTNISYGFLGLNGAIRDITELRQGDHPFVQCATVGQCYPAVFTVNGIRTNRSFWDDLDGTWKDYPPRTPFTCGAFGLEDPGNMGCKLDTTTLPLYRYLCGSSDDVINSCRELMPSKITSLCANIQKEYQASNQDRTMVLAGLRELFYNFPGFNDLDGYLDITTCASEMYSKLNAKAKNSPAGKTSTSLYYPMMFSMYEFPFDWFYQCVLMAGVRINEASRNSQNCRAFKDRAMRDINDYTPVMPGSDTYDTYLRHVRGGYLRTEVENFIQGERRAAKFAVNESRISVQRQMYGSNGDTSYPQCSVNRLWKIGPYGDPLLGESVIPDLRALIWNWYDDQQTCQGNWQSLMIQDLPVSFGITPDNWIDMLTYPDPDELTAQDGVGGQSLLDVVSTAILDSMDITTLGKVTTSSKGCLSFNTIPKPEYDFTSFPVDEYAFAPRKSGVQGVTVTNWDRETKKTCVFHPTYDPAFLSHSLRPDQYSTVCTSYKSGNETETGPWDTLIKCERGSGKPPTVCSRVPKAYSRNGKFSCGYKPAGGIIQDGCNEDTEDRFCYKAVVNALYQSVMIEFATRRSQDKVLSPKAFPWFATNSSFESFDLSLQLDYASNIQPNPERAVMCMLTDEANAIDFNECTNPHFLRLKQHVEENYKHDGPAVIPPGAQLEWPIHSLLMKQGVILSFTNMNRSASKLFMDSLFDENRVCRSENAQQVCWRKGVGEFKSMNPWLLGNFNPFAVCDVEFTDQGEGGREYIYSTCDERHDFCSDFKKQPVTKTCSQYHKGWVSMQGVPRSKSGQFLDYNLCFHTLDEDQDGCLHDQSMLGGYDGLSVGLITGTPNRSVAKNLYEASKWAIPTELKAGLMGGVSGEANPLWQGGSSLYGHLQINMNDIGGHRLELVIERLNETTDTFSVLRLENIPLVTDSDGNFFTKKAGIREISDWVANLPTEMRAEHEEASKLYPSYGAEELGASCPLQRWIFYSGEYTTFSPPIPSSQRASHLFHRVHKGMKSHPIMEKSTNSYLGRYRTSNGFCACPKINDISQEQCLISTSSDSGSPCSLDTTAESLLGGLELTSYVFAPRDHMKTDRKCTMQLDWPSVDATLRDGSKLESHWDKSSNPSDKKCHILDRFRPFRYMYQSKDFLTPLGKNTLKAGACKSGRVVSWAEGPWTQKNTRCTRTYMADNEAAFNCNTSTANPPSLNRRRRLSLKDTLESRYWRKQRCSSCSNPPRFTTEKGREINPESSFGRLARSASVEALLAKDLKEALCPRGSQDCPRLNVSAWKRGQFMENYMLHPERLFASATSTQQAPSPAAKGAKGESAGVWESKPWVYCPTAESLSSGEGCMGTMTRIQWEESRTDLCPKMVHSFSRSVMNGSQGEPMARTPFCVLDNTTDRVCQAIMEARALVRQANCIAKGNLSCMPRPFVYHPASYEPSNNAWVHDTVKEYYKKVAGTEACPILSETDIALQDFARRYQRSCPANAVVLMEGVLTTIRIVVTDVALLLASMVSMFFRTLGLFFTSGASGLKLGIRANWMYIKSKGRAILSSASEILVDAMLNSGEMGQRILVFLQDTCSKVNAAIAWFMRVWCDYVQKYMIEVLFGLRKAIGMIAAGFEIVQDFAEEIFKGILPASFVAKYADKDFKKIMQERYSKPSAHTDKVAAAKNVPKSVNVKSNSASAAAKNTAGKAGDSAMDFTKKASKSPVTKALKGAGYIGAALTIFDIATSIMDAIEEERLRKLWPLDFTLFDFSDVVNVLDDMESFLLKDESCYTYQIYQKAGIEYSLFPCLDASLTNLAGSGSAAGTTSLDATRCWATASPSLGQNSLFSCTASSTCCKTSQCTEFILCGTCPAPQLPDTNQYGCESLQEKCMCNMIKTSISKCSANRQCGLDSECEMISSLSGLSYGTMPCKNCPSQRVVMCLLPPSGMPAKCACMLNKDTEYDLCGEQPATRTMVNNQKLCGYLPSQTPASKTWSFDMDDLIVLPCIQVSEGICSTVFNAGTMGTIHMVVAVTIRSSSFSRGRRLLLDEQAIPEQGPPVHQIYESEYDLVDSNALHALLNRPGWNTTAAPCSSLALAYQGGLRLGVLETYMLHKCAYWRHAGQRLIQRYNLSDLMLEHETFLLSIDDFVYALTSPGVFMALFSQPSILGAATLYHPWFKPLRAFGVMVANQWEHAKWLGDIDSDVHDALFGDIDLHETTKDSDKIEPRFPDNHDALLKDIDLHETTKDSDNTEPGFPDNHDTTPPTGTEQPKGSRGASRRLMSVQDTVNAVIAYSAQTIRSESGKTGGVPNKVAGAWSTAAFTWPPRYDYSLEACPIAKSTFMIGRQVALVNKLYIENFNRPLKPIDKSLRGNLPGWDWLHQIKMVPEVVTGKAKSWASATFHWMLDLLAIPPSQMLAFFTMKHTWSLAWVLDTAIQCDLASTLTCSKHDKDLLMSTVIFILLCLVIKCITDVLGVGFLGILFIFLYPWFILWYTFGMPPTCFPMLPTCLLADIISTTQAVLPEAVLFPPNLLCHPSEARLPLNQTCLRTCEDLNFKHWVDPLAFAVCDTDPQTCRYLASLGDSGVEVLDSLVWSPFRLAASQFNAVIATGELAGHRLCTWVSFVTTTPALAVVVLGVVLLGALVAALLDLVPLVVAFVCQMYIFYGS